MARAESKVFVLNISVPKSVGLEAGLAPSRGNVRPHQGPFPDQTGRLRNLAKGRVGLQSRLHRHPNRKGADGPLSFAPCRTGRLMFELTLGGLYTGVNRQNFGKIRADSMGCGIHLCTDKSETVPGMSGPKKTAPSGAASMTGRKSIAAKGHERRQI